MAYEHLWAPWRLGYIKGTEPPADKLHDDALDWLPGADRDCFICRATAERRDRENLLVWRGGQVVVILNRYPYNNGHLLVTPQRHVASLDGLSDAEHLECLRTIDRLVRLLTARMNAEGFNVGLNLGRVAGAGLPGHLHWHVVPRWYGDTNFMPVLAGIRVIPQSLDALWELMHEGLAAGPDDKGGGR